MRGVGGNVPGRTCAIAIGVIAAYSVALLGVVAVFNLGGEPTPERVTVRMGLALVLTWVVGFGVPAWLVRRRFAAWFTRVPGGWQVKFVAFAVAFALLEEGIAVSVTNLAPAFGVPLGAAWVTASSNYLHVVLLSSVVPLILPWALAWAWLLGRYRFSPAGVVLGFGVLGTLAESSLDPRALVAGFWVLVYGLMVFLPAYAVPDRPAARPARLRAGLLALVLPMVAAIPFLAVTGILRDWLGIDFLTDVPAAGVAGAGT